MSDFNEWISCVWPARRYSKKFAKFRAWKDAKAGLPAVDAHETISERLQACHGVKLPAGCDSAKDLVEIHQCFFLGYLAELRNAAKQALCRAVMEFQRRDGFLKARQKGLEKRLAESQASERLFEKLYPDYDRRILVHPWAYYAIVTVCALAEIPLNLVAFRLFGENEYLTLLVALVIAVTIPVIAHWTGAVLKQPFRTRVDSAVLVVSIVVVFAAIASVGYVREIYLIRLGEEPNALVTWGFIGLQMLFFGIAAFLSYGSHSLKEDLENRTSRLSVALQNTKTRRKELQERKRDQSMATWTVMNEILGAYSNENSVRGGNARHIKEKIVVDHTNTPLMQDLDNDDPVEPASEELAEEDA